MLTLGGFSRLGQNSPGSFGGRLRSHPPSLLPTGILPARTLQWENGWELVVI